MHSSHSSRFITSMTRRSLVDARVVLGAIAASLALLATGLLIPLADLHGQLSLFLGLFFALAVVIVLLVVPIRFLPGITLLVTLLVPTELNWLPHTLQGAPFGVVPLAVWIIRAPKAGQIPTSLRILASLFGVWLFLSTAFAPLHTHKGLEWLFTIGMATVFAVISAPMGLKTRDFRALFLNVVTILGAYALLEGFVLHQNVLFGALFEHTSWWATQRFAASYRVTTLLGHPLNNGLVFSAAAVLAASDLTKKSRRTPIALVRFLVLLGATDATHSRGASVALAIGVLVTIIFSRAREQGWATRRLVLGISLLFGIAVLAYGVKARNESSGGQASAQVRVTVIKRALEAVHDVGPFGAGPGESEAYRRAKQLPESTVDLENSYAQLAVSLGPTGAILMLTLLIAVVIYGFKNELVTGEAAALLTILIDIAGFNAIEGHASVGILIALFVIAIITAPRTLLAQTNRYSRSDSDASWRVARTVPTPTAMYAWLSRGFLAGYPRNAARVV